MMVTGAVVVNIKINPNFIKKAVKIAKDFDKSCIKFSKMCSEPIPALVKLKQK